jgi:hypothetical protein
LEAILNPVEAAMTSTDLLEAILNPAEAAMTSMDLLEVAMMSADLFEAILNLLDQLEDMLNPCRHGGVCSNLGRRVKGRQDLHGPVGSHHNLSQLYI